MQIPVFRSSRIVARVIPNYPVPEHGQSTDPSAGPHAELVFDSRGASAVELVYNVNIEAIFTAPIDKTILTVDLTSYMQIISSMCGNALRVKTVRYFERTYNEGMLRGPSPRIPAKPPLGRSG